MKLRAPTIHNYRSVTDLCIEVHDYTLLVGPNNAGKSTGALPPSASWRKPFFRRALLLSPTFALLISIAEGHRVVGYAC